MPEAQHATKGSKGPLDGIVVVEVANFVSGPFATMMLAELGAEVIKVEPEKGDPYRRFGRPTTVVSPYFANANRGKRSVTLDLKSEAGHSDLLRLLATADVLLANWRPSVADKLGLADDVLAATNPRLIRAYITGFGADGPLAAQPVFDSVIQARSGMTDSQSTTEGRVASTTFIVDKVTAMTACQGVLAALVGRQLTGLGDRVDVAMLDAASYFNFQDAMAGRTFVDHQPASAKGVGSSVRPVRTSDGWLMIAPVSGAHIGQCCRAVGHPEWIDDLKAHTVPAAMTADLFNRVESVTQSDTTARWLAAFATSDVPAAPCHTLDEHFTDEQVLHNQLYSIVDTPGVGPTRLVRYPVTFGRWGRVGTDDVAPTIGQDNDDILGAMRRPAT